MTAPSYFFNKDVGVVLTITALKPDLTAFNLTGMTVSLVAQDTAGVAPTGSPFSCTITAPTSGTVQFTITSGVWSAGAYRCQLKIVNGPNTYYSNVFMLLVGSAIG